MSNHSTIRLTMAQAAIRFLQNQYTERDGVEQRFFAGCFGIFGHGNVAGMGQALHQYPDFRYYQTRNEQSIVDRASCASDTVKPAATNVRVANSTGSVPRLTARRKTLP